MGVDLRAVARSCRGEAEGVHGPVEVGILVGAAQRQQFTQCGLVDLDDPDAGGFQVCDFITQGKTHLVGRVAEGLVVADEAPRQDGDGACQHALHGLAGQRLGIGGPVHRDGFLAGNISPQDGRAGAAAAVGLDPAVDRHVKAFEVFGKVLDHVVAFGLAVDQYVKVQLFLQVHHPLDFFLHQGRVFRIGDGPLVRAGTGGADVTGLREGADGGGGQRRQGQRLFLRGFTHRILGAVEIGRGQRG